MFFLGLMVKGCSGDGSASRGGADYDPQAGTYQSTPALSPPQVKLAMARDGTVIANPERYVPKTVILGKPVEVGSWDGETRKGTKTLPVGTEVKVKAVEGYDVYAEIDGHWEVIKASATDLLDQMAQAAVEVE